MGSRHVVVFVVVWLAAARAGAQPTPTSAPADEPALAPAPPPDAQGDQPASAPSSQPASAPASRPAPPLPPSPPLPPPLAQPVGPGERCAQHSDCIRPLWCVEQMCQVARPPGSEAPGGRLAVEKGNMQLGGSLTVTPTVSSPEGRDSTSGAVLTINPTFGYFISDGFEIGLSFQAGVGIGELFEQTASTLQIGPMVRYIFNTSGPVVPYLGLLIGPNLIIPEQSDTVAFFDISFRLGLFIPFTRNIALNLGIRPTFSIRTGDAGGMIFTIPVGWLGVEVFF